MKRTAALLLALILMLSAFAQASFDFDIVRLYSDPPTYLVETANSWDLVDEKGQLLQQNYVDDFYELKPGLYCAERDGLLGVMNDKGQWLKQPVFDDIWDFSEGLAVAILNGLYGYLDEDFNWAIEPVYEDADEFSGGLAVVKKDAGRQFAWRQALRSGKGVSRRLRFRARGRRVGTDRHTGRVHRGARLPFGCHKLW